MLHLEKPVVPDADVTRAGVQIAAHKYPRRVGWKSNIKRQKPFGCPGIFLKLNYIKCGGRTQTRCWVHPVLPTSHLIFHFNHCIFAVLDALHFSVVLDYLYSSIPSTQTFFRDSLTFTCSNTIPYSLRSVQTFVPNQESIV